MKRLRDNRGRFAKRYRKATIADKILVGVIINFFVGSVLYHEALAFFQTTPMVAPELEEIVEPKEVRIEVIYNWDTERIEEEIRMTFPEYPELAVAVGKSESGKTLYHKAYNPEWHYDKHGNKVCQGSFGVMQVACVHLKEDPEKLYDPIINLRIARQVHDDSLTRRGSGWLPWGGYTSGGYKKFL